MSQKKDNLGIRLLRAESAAEVRDIIAGDKSLSNPGNWMPVDGRVTNSNVVNNQSTNGGKAATELITNMVDAMLTKRCLEENIDPKGAEAPTSMYEAVDKFVRPLNGGRIIDADPKWKREYARENLIIGISAKTRNATPCYTFADNGEGQYPRMFRDTFLSLSQQNKSQIPFVQGKYNMGSSGVLNFCEDWLKLIVSRRYDKKEDWGWTLIRKNEPQSGMPYAEYFAPDGDIQTVGSGAIAPFCNQGKEFDGIVLQTGTIVKLYDFFVGKGYADFKGARETFNENLVETILPFRICDFRWKPDPSRGGLRKFGIDDRSFYGMEHQLVDPQSEEASDDDDDPKSVGRAKHIDTVNHPDLGQITITAVTLEKLSGWYKRSGNRIFHHVNGQVQFKQTRGMLTQCKLSALKDRVAIFVDASRLHDAAHNAIWKGDRESVYETRAGQQYKDAVKEAIQESPKLKELNHKFARDELDSASADSSRDLIRELVARDSSLAALLSGMVPDIPVPRPPNKPRDIRQDLKYSPTYVKVNAKGGGGSIDINLPINKTRPVPCTTDVQDDYFIRAKYRGDIVFENDDTADKFSFRRKLENGELVVFLTPNRGRLKAGDTESVRFGLRDDAMVQPVYADKTLRITLVDAATKKTRTRSTPSEQKQSVAGLPQRKLVTKDGRQINGEDTLKWEEAGSGVGTFDKEAGGYVKKLDENESVYYINYDNAYFQTYLNKQKKERQAEVAEKYVLGMRILMLGLERAIEEAEKDDVPDGDKLRWVATKGVATVVLSICDQLPQSFNRLTQGDEAGE